MASRSHWLKVVAVLGLAAVITFLALRSSPYLQYIPWMPRRIGVWADSNGIGRNAVAFFALALPVFLLVGRRLVHGVALAAFATVIEVAQLWIPGRVFDWRDIVASVAGIVVAWAVSWAVRRAAGSKRC